jgi:RNA polymerase sigma factor (sigma-70 family)
MNCTINECENDIFSKGYCQKHYMADLRLRKSEGWEKPKPKPVDVTRFTEQQLGEVREQLLQRVLQKITKNVAEAEDLVQDAFVTFLLSGDSYKGKGGVASLASYIYAIIVRDSQDRQRSINAYQKEQSKPRRMKQDRFGMWSYPKKKQANVDPLDVADDYLDRIATDGTGTAVAVMRNEPSLIERDDTESVVVTCRYCHGEFGSWAKLRNHMKVYHRKNLELLQKA